MHPIRPERCRTIVPCRKLRCTAAHITNNHFPQTARIEPFAWAQDRPSAAGSKYERPINPGRLLVFAGKRPVFVSVQTALWEWNIMPNQQQEIDMYQERFDSNQKQFGGKAQEPGGRGTHDTHG